MSSATIPYIGSKISLISKSDIRYEGTLKSIDPTEHTVTLTSVKYLGTEGRRGPDNEIPPAAETYEIIIFRGSDIKDLTVIQTNPILSDPAIINATKAPQERRERRPFRSRRGARHPYGELHQAANPSLKEQYKEEYQFSDPLPHAHPQGPGAYDKKQSFFDSLSSNTSEESRFDRGKQKQLDVETFGEDSVSSAEKELRRYMSRGRRRGRGFRPRPRRY